MSAAHSMNLNFHEGAVYCNLQATVVRLEHIRENYCEYTIVQSRRLGHSGVVLSPCEAFINAFVLLADSESEWRSQHQSRVPAAQTSIC